MTIDNKEIFTKIDAGIKKLDRLNGKKKVAYLFKLNNLIKCHAEQLADYLFNKNSHLIKSTRSIEAAHLMHDKALYCLKNNSLDEADMYADTTLTLSRDIGANELEIHAMNIKARIYDLKGQHKKVVPWYIMALEKCPKIQRPNVLHRLGIYLYNQEEYDRAFVYLNDAIKDSDRFIHSKSTAKDIKMILVRIQVKCLLWLAATYESIGDVDAAQRAYDRSIELCSKFDLILDLFSTLSRKVQLLIITKNFAKAQYYLYKAENLPLSEEEREKLSFVIDWALLYMNVTSYVAMREEFEELNVRDGLATLGIHTVFNKKATDQDIFDFIKSKQDYYGEILTGFNDMFLGMGLEEMIKKAYSAAERLEKFQTKSGIYKGMDKQSKDNIKQHTVNILANLFEKNPYIVRYKGIIAKYDLIEETAKVTKDGKDIDLNKRAFLILKYFIDHLGECVTQAELEELWILHGEAHHILKGEQSGIGTYLKRDIREKLGLDQFIVKCPKPQRGWILSP